MAQPIWWQYFKAVAGTEDGQTIAAAAGVTPPQASRWKTGKNRPSADQVIKFARHFERPPVEALMSTGYLTLNDVDGVIEMSSASTEDLEDRELLDELGRRLSVRRNEVERIVVQFFVAVGQLQSFVEAMRDGDEDEDIDEVSDRLGVLMHSLNELATTYIPDRSRLAKLTANIAVNLRARQTQHTVPDAQKDDLVGQITAWPFDYSRVRQYSAGMEYVRDEDLLRVPPRQRQQKPPPTADPEVVAGSVTQDDGANGAKQSLLAEVLLGHYVDMYLMALEQQTRTALVEQARQILNEDLDPDRAIHPEIADGLYVRYIAARHTAMQGGKPEDHAATDLTAEQREAATTRYLRERSEMILFDGRIRTSGAAADTIAEAVHRVAPLGYTPGTAEQGVAGGEESQVGRVDESEVDPARHATWSIDPLEPSSVRDDHDGDEGRELGNG